MQSISRQRQEHIIHKFDNVSDDFRVILSSAANVEFCGIVDNSKVSINFDVMEEGVSADCYFLVQGKEDQKVYLNIQTNFFASNTKILIHIIVLAADNAEVKLNGNIHIDKGIEKVEGKLYEETLLIGNAKYISMVPGLRVESPDVIASHGAKVQRISQERLFYMQSRGLSEENAVQMLVNSYSEFIVGKMNLTEEEKEKFYLLLA